MWTLTRLEWIKEKKMLKVSHQMWKAQRKRWVFSLDLKSFRFSHCLKCIGSAFHATGPATEKDLVPYWVLVCLIASKAPFSERRDLDGQYGWIIEDTYGGARLCRALNVNMHSLYWILVSTGNQWRFSSTGVICSSLRTLHTILAAVFWASWRLLRWHFGWPARSAFA